MCERIASGETLNEIASEPGMPSRSTIDRWRTDRPEFKRQYDIAVQLRADGLLEETIEIIDDKKEIVTETTTECSSTSLPPLMAHRRPALPE